mgnify:CR=1 FL=1
MNLERRRLMQAAAGSLLLSLAPVDIAWGAKMIAVRMWPAEEYTRVTLESDAPLKYRHFFVRSAKPIRLVVDIDGLQLTESLKRQIAAVKPDDPYIASMRIGQYKPGTVRLVMDLKTDVKPEVFLLKPFANYQYRLVFDIYPEHPRDSIGQILASRDDTDILSAPTEEDPLASVLESLGKDTSPPSSKPSGGGSASGKPSNGKPPTGDKKNASSKKASRSELVIVVDPGHGGEDPGAIGRQKTQEKTVVLQIARRLAKLIEAEPGMKAILTRNSDHFVSLGGRVAIARKARAHLLVSIHADAWVKSSARGSSVFALSQKGATSAAARWLAKSQNESDMIGGVNIKDVDRQVASVLVDMTSNWTIGYSLGLGTAVLQEIKGINRLHKNHVEQAGFAVLKGQGIPSILVETAFISNPEEEKLLRSTTHQQKIARAIFTGIKKQLAADSTLLN